MKIREFFNDPENGSRRKVAAALMAGAAVLGGVITSLAPENSPVYHISPKYFTETGIGGLTDQIGELVAPDEAIVCPQEGALS